MTFHCSIDAHVGLRVRCAREAHGLTAGRFADVLGLTASQLHLFECGAERLGPVLLFNAAKALSIDLKEFFSNMPLSAQCGNIRLSLVAGEDDVDEMGFMMQ